MSTSLNLAFIVLISALAFTTGCGKNDDAKDPKIATQVAARVNGDEITVHQVNDVLARNPNIAPEFANQAKSEILDRLIDQQLTKQKAIENKLDRSPKVMRAIEAAKSEILALDRREQEFHSLRLRSPASPLESGRAYSRSPSAL